MGVSQICRKITKEYFFLADSCLVNLVLQSTHPSTTNSRSWHAKSRKATKKIKESVEGMGEAVQWWLDGRKGWESCYDLESWDLDDHVFNGCWVPSKRPHTRSYPLYPQTLVRRDLEKRVWPEETSTRQTTWWGGQCSCCWGQSGVGGEPELQKYQLSSSHLC